MAMSPGKNSLSWQHCQPSLAWFLWLSLIVEGKSNPWYLIYH